MSRDLWNSPAAVVRVEDNGRGLALAVGGLHEMIDYLLREPVGERDALRVRLDGHEDLIEPAEAQDLRSRANYPCNW